LNIELAEETKERRTKAFKQYEEYCEKRKFRLLSPRACPAIDKCKCGAC
jgi:ribosome recycling factor